MARENPEASVLSSVINQGYTFSLWTAFGAASYQDRDGHSDALPGSGYLTQFIASVGVSGRASSTRGESPQLGSSTPLSFQNQLFQSSCSRCPVPSERPGLRANLYIKAGLEDSRAPQVLGSIFLSLDAMLKAC